MPVQTPKAWEWLLIIIMATALGLMWLMWLR